MTKPAYAKEDVLGLEPKHVTYVRAQDYSNHDLLVVKENVHLKDGTRVPNLRLILDYNRSFWVTHPGRRTHKEKKDYELASNLQRYRTTQIEMTKQIAKTLGDYSSGPNPPLRRLARSPYLYGADVTSSCLIKHDYKEKWPDLMSLNTVAAGDIETNVHSQEGEIICMSVSYKDRACLVYLKSWIGDIKDPIKKTHEAAQKYIGETLKERNIQLEVVVVNTPAEVVIHCMKRLHEWKPDFFTFWNMDFDIQNMTRALDREGYDLSEVFSDPSVPPEFRYYHYREGQRQKVTASGKTTSINIEDRWSWVTHPATFQIIDSLPVYRILRLADGKEPSYALDAILTKELDITKLKFDEVSHLSGLRWHEVMQRDYKIEYGVYNIFDSISLELLDEKTRDLSSQITTMSRFSDYKNFNSSPKRLCDDMHFWYLRQDPQKVIGTSSSNPVEEIDELVVGHDDWIN